MPILTLHGCSPEPLGHYLKALGVFRLVAEQADPSARAWWENGTFRLSTTKFASVTELGDWLHETCAYTAFVAPWRPNTGWGKRGDRTKNADASGKAAKGEEALSKLLADKSPRTTRFRIAATLVMKSAGLNHPTGDELPSSKKEVEAWVGAFHKDDEGAIISQLRNQATPEMLSWLDSVGAIRPKDAHLTKDWFPLFAKGGTEGSGSYIVSQQNYLAESFTANPELGRQRLECCLTGGTMKDLLKTSLLSGLFYSGFRSDPNIGQSFATNSRANPWDFILLMEGLLFFRSATTRRLGVEQGKSAFPFYCESSLGGSHSVGIREVPESDKSISDGELWCPLWDSPMNSRTLSGLLSEGRFQVTGRSVKKAAQFALAVARFGCDRGIKAFLRYGIIRRSGSGKNTFPLAIALGVFPVTRLPKLAMVEELLDFDDLFGFGGNSRVHPGSGHNHPARIVSAWAAYDVSRFKAVVSAQAGAGDDDLVNLNIALGNLVREFAVTTGRVRQGRGENAKAPSKPNAPLPPPLDRKWTKLTPEENHTEFNLARAVASILPWGESVKNPSIPTVGALLTNLLPVTRNGQRWVWDELTRSPVWSEGVSLLGNLAAVMQRRLVDAQSSKEGGLPFVSVHPASFTDLWRLWNGEVDETRLSELIRALALVDFRSQQNQTKFDAWQASNDATPNLTQSGVWFDSNDQARLTLRETSGIPANELEAAFALPRSYALLKLCFIAGRLPALPAEKGSSTRSGREPFPNSPLPILNLLLAGRSAEALQTAARMLKAKGYPPIVPQHCLASGEWQLSPSDSQGLAGLLLIPVRRVGVLAALSIKPQPNR